MSLEYWNRSPRRVAFAGIPFIVRLAQGDTCTLDHFEPETHGHSRRNDDGVEVHGRIEGFLEAARGGEVRPHELFFVEIELAGARGWLAAVSAGGRQVGHCRSPVMTGPLMTSC